MAPKRCKQTARIRRPARPAAAMSSKGVPDEAVVVEAEAGIRGNDTSTEVSEMNWWDAELHWPEVCRFCEQWNGVRDLDLVSTFDFSKKVLKTWLSRGSSGVAYDIKSGGIDEDVIGKDGFMALLGLLMRLKPRGMNVSAPPCSNFIGLSINVHQRHVFGPEGNVAVKSVRLTNLISSNCAVALHAQMLYRPDTYGLVEQPKSSFMLKREIYQQLAKNGFSKVLTYQGPYGADLEKGTHVLHNLQMGHLLGSRMTKDVKAKFLEKKAQKAARSETVASKVHVQKKSDGSFHGTKELQSTSIYPQRFCTALHKVWVLSKAQAGS